MIKIKRNNKSGFTLIEVIVVLALIGILSSLLSVYVVNSSKISSSIKKDYDQVSEARIAISYVTNLIQQNDISNAISLDTKNASKPVLKVKRGDNLNQTVEVYYDSTEKKLMEKIEDDTKTSYNSIANISGFNIQYISGEKVSETKSEATGTEGETDKKKSEDSKTDETPKLNYIVITVSYKDVNNGDGTSLKSFVQNISLRSTNYTLGGKS